MNLLLLSLGTHQIKWQIQIPPSWFRLPIVLWGEFSLFMWVQHPHQIFGNSCLLTAWRYCAPFSSGFSPQVAWSLDVTWSCRLLFLDQLHLHSDSFEYISIYIYLLTSFHEHGCLVDIGCCSALFLHAWVIAADNSDWHHSDLVTSIAARVYSQKMFSSLNPNQMHGFLYVPAGACAIARIAGTVPEATALRQQLRMRQSDNFSMPLLSTATVG